jgi:putative transposase
MRRQESATIARFITFSCYQRLPLLHNHRIMDLFASLLSDTRTRHGLRLYAWVVMPEHVHLVCRAAGSPWSTVAQYIKTGVSKRVFNQWRKLGSVAAPVLASITTADGSQRFWQHGGGFDRRIRTTQAMARDIRYIHRNPVERGLVSQPEDWKWSSVRWWMGLRDGEIECDSPMDPSLDPAHWKGFM